MNPLFSTEGVKTAANILKSKKSTGRDDAYAEFIKYDSAEFYFRLWNFQMKPVDRCRARKVSIFGVFLVHIFQYLEVIQISPNARKYGTENSDYIYILRCGNYSQVT